MVLCAGTIALSGCKKNPEAPQKVKPKAEKIYMPQAQNNPVKIILTTSMATDTVEYNASFGGNAVAKNDLIVHFKVDSALVDKYNSIHSTSFKLLPRDNYTLSGMKETLHAGDSEGSPLKLIIFGNNPALISAQNYLLPITVNTNKDSIEVDEDLKTTYFVIQNKIKPIELFMPQAQNNPVHINITSTSPNDTVKYNASIGVNTEAENNITIQFSVDGSLVSSYNSAHSTSLELLPEDNYKLSDNTETIHAGDSESSPLKLIIFGNSPALKSGQNYLLPLTVSTNDDISVNKKLQTTYYVIQNNIVNAEKPTGQGTKTNPYKIDDLANLKWISIHSSTWSDSFIQTKDINASATEGWNDGGGFKSIGNKDNKFNGTYDGQNHLVQGLFINRPSQNGIGFFGITGKDAVIKNVNLKNIDISGQKNTGGLVGMLGGKVVGSEINGSQGIIKGKSNVGGLVGNNNGTIKGSQANVDVMGAGNLVGGLVGYSQSTDTKIINSHATGNVQAKGQQAGGLVGNSHALIKNSYATGDVKSGKIYTGGLVGVNNGPVQNSYAKGNVNSSSAGDAGGLIGFNNKATITHSYAMGNVTGQAHSNGGFIGLNSGKVMGCYSEGDVKSLKAASTGGLIGFSNATGDISGSFATGDVNGSNGGNTGGLVGDASGATITNSYATGKVTAASGNTGGLAGNLKGGVIKTSYSVGMVSGNDPQGATGGLVGGGTSSSTVEHSYWDTEVSKQNSSFGGGTGRETNQMEGSAAKTNMVGFDFAHIWQTNKNNYPTLRNNHPSH
jgi:hypothetical protein